MPNFIKFGGTRTSRQYGEMYTSRTFIFLQEISWEAHDIEYRRLASAWIHCPGSATYQVTDPEP